MTPLKNLSYQLIETGMRERYFLRKLEAKNQVFHFHIVALPTGSHRKERVMRDYLLNHPEKVKAYGQLKQQLAQSYADDSAEYTKAKTTFIQTIVGKAPAELGLSSVDVWAELNKRGFSLLTKTVAQNIAKHYLQKVGLPVK